MFFLYATIAFVAVIILFCYFQKDSASFYKLVASTSGLLASLNETGLRQEHQI